MTLSQNKKQKYKRKGLEVGREGARNIEEYRLVIKLWPTVCEALSSIPNVGRMGEKTRNKQEVVGLVWCHL